MTYTASRALELLRSGAGQAQAGFRAGQEAAIRHVVEGRGRLLVVQKTGWGKSFVYFIATKLLRESGHGPALLISPLLALMRNQITAAQRMGIRAVTIHSDNRGEWRDVETAVARGEVDILLISPERLANEHFRTEVLSGIATRIALLVIDEAHCISDWGHDFRPHYRLLERIVRALPPNLRLLATTATANNRVMDDLREILGPDLAVSRGDLNRPSLALQTMRLPSQAERLAWLAEQVPAMRGHGIIYTLTKRDAVQVAEWLRSRGADVEHYTELRRIEKQQMQAYVALESGHMAFLIGALDGEPGAINPPVLPALPTTTSPGLTREAVAFLRRTSLPIEPRQKWPAGGMPRYKLKGQIPAEQQAQPGKVLCVWGDAGWGGQVREGKYHDRRFGDELISACAALVRQWQPQPAPTWVTCVPSLRQLELVPDFARRLATRLGLPFYSVLVKTDNRPEQKTMANSTQQARNIDGSLGIVLPSIPNGPVMLVDDMVDSRWTLTVAAWLLRTHGSGDVWPLALAQTGEDV